MALIGELLNIILRDNEQSIQTTTNPYVIQSKPNLFTGALTQQALITPPSGKSINIQGITITSDGSNGQIYL